MQEQGFFCSCRGHIAPLTRREGEPAGQCGVFDQSGGTERQGQSALPHETKPTKSGAWRGPRASVQNIPTPTSPALVNPSPKLGSLFQSPGSNESPASSKAKLCLITLLFCMFPLYSADVTAPLPPSRGNMESIKDARNGGASTHLSPFASFSSGLDTSAWLASATFGF